MPAGPGTAQDEILALEQVESGPIHLGQVLVQHRGHVRGIGQEIAFVAQQLGDALAERPIEDFFLGKPLVAGLLSRRLVVDILDPLGFAPFFDDLLERRSRNLYQSSSIPYWRMLSLNRPNAPRPWIMPQSESEICLFLTEWQKSAMISYSLMSNCDGRET